MSRQNCDRPRKKVKRSSFEKIQNTRKMRLDCENHRGIFGIFSLWPIYDCHASQWDLNFGRPIRSDNGFIAAHRKYIGAQGLYFRTWARRLKYMSRLYRLNYGAQRYFAYRTTSVIASDRQSVAWQDAASCDSCSACVIRLLNFNNIIDARDESRRISRLSARSIYFSLLNTRDKSRVYFRRDARFCQVNNHTCWINFTTHSRRDTRFARLSSQRPGRRLGACRKRMIERQLQRDRGAMTSSRVVSERAFILQYATTIKYRCAIAAARLLHNGVEYRVKGDEIHRAQLLADTRIRLSNLKI